MTCWSTFGQSLLLAYLLIMGLMTIAMRSPVAGLLAMLPNAVPCLTVFGLLGWHQIVASILA